MRVRQLRDNEAKLATTPESSERSVVPLPQIRMCTHTRACNTETAPLSYSEEQHVPCNAPFMTTTSLSASSGLLTLPTAAGVVHEIDVPVRASATRTLSGELCNMSAEETNDGERHCHPQPHNDCVGKSRLNTPITSRKATHPALRAQGPRRFRRRCTQTQQRRQSCGLLRM